MMWTYAAWAGNISAGIIVSFVMSMLWPSMRKRYESWFDSRMHKHLETHHNRVIESISDKLDEHMDRVHEHLSSGVDPRNKETP